MIVDQNEVTVTKRSPFRGMMCRYSEITTMRIEEVIRSCAVGPVAEAAVASVGGRFAVEVERAAQARGLSVGDFAVTSVKRFARNGRESEMRAVASVMATSQVPVLAAIECIVAHDLPRGSVHRL